MVVVCFGAARLAPERSWSMGGFPFLPFNSSGTALYDNGILQARINHSHSEPKKRHGEADAIRRAAQLSV